MQRLIGYRTSTYDKVYTGFIAGTIGGLVTLAVDLLFYGAGAAKTMILQQVYMVLPGVIALNPPSSLMMGAAAHRVEVA